MTALQTIAATNKNLAVNQNRIATGLKVADASDNAAYWSIATTMRTDNAANDTILGSLGVGQAKIDAAYTATSKAVDILKDIHKAVLSAKGQDAGSRAKIQTEIEQKQEQLKEIAKISAAGTNILSTDSTAKEKGFSITASYNRGPDGSVKTSTIDVDLASVRLVDTVAKSATNTTPTKTGILDKESVIEKAAAGGTDVKTSVLELNVSAADMTEARLDKILELVDTAAKDLATSASVLGATKNRIESQVAFVKAISDAVDRGIGALVDADMNKESARFNALKTQQQLGVQALSIANAEPQNILALFR